MGWSLEVAAKSILAPQSPCSEEQFLMSSMHSQPRFSKHGRCKKFFSPNACAIPRMLDISLHVFFRMGTHSRAVQRWMSIKQIAFAATK
eukprot:3612044-Amphidinium_carterae.1